MQTVIFTITPVSADGCTGDLFTAVVNVNPEPIGAAVPALQTVCSSVPITTVVFSTVNNLPGSTFAWTRDNTANVTGMPASGSGDISGTLVNLTGVIQTVTFTVIPSSAIGCAGNPFTVVIVVEPEPFAFNITGGRSFCAGEIGVVVGLDGSQIGKLYQLMIDGVLSGPLV
ncbi:MAG: hypothetical protein MUD02_02275, partial [Bacteroidales bacterium]|nr:hypothetical protein [Bacteroidales bacterium]